ncbi:hypothetical protein PUNSTDRAFT_99509 [Punctularia strigosozonata HHB-11173 SS5]|uniref:uncharacterized protein n=1 Tax=Punctularia strigosozonata (strain HHB-11173) TaxID=741275 RepID=UPI00044166C1|nr:uncharacterized protein PUNSTDRAFT_99509 [Punctularia strigosozonata HHB-11173 SS5]EIN12093.1 hypothetical protein PUNSTDRAFT_99509 [Punctularia strigosozonata HHB-11173 SS5]
MRRHSGNKPVLPQTKQCPHCDAKYTRQTHLNRHMKIHTREGMHICELCQAEFTRSDLLSRHRKSCMRGTARRGRQREATGDKTRPSDRFTGSSPDDLRDFLLSMTSGTPCSAVASTSGQATSSAIDSHLSSQLSGMTAAGPSGGFLGNMFDALFNDVVVGGNSDTVDRRRPSSTDQTETFPYLPQLLDSFNAAAANAHPFPIPQLSTDSLESPRELDHYEYLFYTEYLSQMPVFHATTLSSAEKPPILLDAIRACGALYVKTGRAFAFTKRVLESTREALAKEFATHPTDSDEQIYLVLAVSLLQNIGLFHQQSDVRTISNIFHGMLVMLVRRMGLITRNAAWHPTSFDTSDPLSIEVAWRDWAKHETEKRSLFLSYLHDISHRMCFALPTCYMPAEVTLHLPCEGKLWNAASASEWHAALCASSPYGTMQERLTGVPIQYALEVLRHSRVPTSELKLTLNPMAHLLLIKVLLSELYALAAPSGCQLEPAKEKSQVILDFQFVLHNWLGTWLAGPDTPPIHPEPIFYFNALPFYWLAQISLMAYQEDMPPFQMGSASRSDADSRFRLINWWQRCIRNFLRFAGNSAQTDSTAVWAEMMRIRLDGWRLEMEGDAKGYIRTGGPLAFFANSGGDA